jgi:hypothetical protein
MVSICHVWLPLQKSFLSWCGAGSWSQCLEHCSWMYDSWATSPSTVMTKYTTIKSYPVSQNFVNTSTECTQNTSFLAKNLASGVKTRTLNPICTWDMESTENAFTHTHTCTHTKLIVTEVKKSQMYLSPESLKPRWAHGIKSSPKTRSRSNNKVESKMATRGRKQAVWNDGKMKKGWKPFSPIK